MRTLLRGTAKGRRALMTAVASVLVVALSACDDSVRIWHTPRGDAQAIYKMMAEGGQGFEAGSADAKQTVYVLFDPQCPHCGRLWRTSQPLLASGKVKFVWMPVAAMRPQSAVQGAAILAAVDPSKMMTEHEGLLLSNKGGLGVTTAPNEKLAIVLQNTRLANKLNIDQVPYLATKRINGSEVVASGEMTSTGLAAFIGLTEEPAAPSSPASH